MIKIITLFTAGLLVIFGCSSKINFYQLELPDSFQNNTEQINAKTVVSVREVEIAEYLDRAELVIKGSNGEVKVRDSDMWIGSLSKNIQTLLVSTLSKENKNIKFLAYPWIEPIKEQYKLFVTLNQFDSYQDGRVELKGRWSLVNAADNNVIQSDTFSITKKGGSSISEIVKTLSEAIVDLAALISKNLQKNV